MPRRSRKLFAYLFPVFLSLAVLTLALVAFGAHGFLDRILLQMEEDNLRTQISILSGEFDYLVDSKLYDLIDPRCDALGKATGCRYAVILADGRVLGDSAVSPDKTEHHLSLVEVRQALRGKPAVDIRESRSTGDRYLFAAVPLGKAQVTGVLRIARPYSAISALSKTVYFRFLLGLLVVLGFALLLSLGVSRWLAGLFGWFVGFVRGFRPEVATAPVPLPRVLPREAVELKEAIVDLIGRFSSRVSRLDRLAYSDSLTGLPNRTRLYDEMERAIANAGPDVGFALFFCDLDRFKEVNDTFGHQTGDRLLIEAADRLKGFERDDRLVARLGGDEFCLLFLHPLGKEEAAEMARAIGDCLVRPFSLDGEEIRISVSIGMAFYPGDGENRSELLRAADMAMYGAKLGTTEGFCFAEGVRESGQKRFAPDVSGIEAER